MDTIDNNNEIRFTMRMDKELYEKLKASAKVNKRSIAKELEYLVELQFDTAEDMNDQIKNIQSMLNKVLDNQRK